jgi:alpha-tubulin suppressor-like RCC1 family protein
MGNNTYGQLGIGFAPPTTNLPQQVLSSGVGTVAAGGFHSLFRMGSSLWAMGINADGELGDGTTTNHAFPEKIFSGSASISVTVVGSGPLAGHSLFATSGFVVGSTGLRGMGYNLDGELGDGTYTNHISPETIESSAASTAACGYQHSLFVRTDGSLWAMGDDSYGQLGQFLGLFLPVNTNRPIIVVSNSVTAVAAGGFHSLFIKSDGSLWAMGDNDAGQLGDGTVSERILPVRVATNGVTAIAAGGAHSLYINSDGSLWGIGYNAFGQLGDGTTNDHHIAIQIVASNVVAAAAGYYHSLFIKSDGSLWGMGDNSSGQLGDGSYTNHLTPFQIVAGLPPAPRITGISLAGANLNLNGTNGESGEILYTLMSTNLTESLSQWQPVATNVLHVTGSFTITATNAATPGAPQQFYILQAQ